MRCADGYAIVRGALDGAIPQDSKRSGGTRSILWIPAIRTLAESDSIRRLVDPVLGVQARPIGAIYFDKTPAANWKVPWHQDLMIPVRERIETPGYTSWSTKPGIPRVHPPARVLENMMAVRIHLDDCGPGNGPLRVIPASHQSGNLTDDEIDRCVAESRTVTCCVSAGDALLMSPLMLHASSVSTEPRHRRVIHLDYAGALLDGELQWP